MLTDGTSVTETNSETRIPERGATKEESSVTEVESKTTAYSVGFYVDWLSVTEIVS